MQSNILYLLPKNPDVEPNLQRLVQQLRQLEFIDTEFDFKGRNHYRPGELFLQLVTFLGCSPVVSLGAPGLTGEEFCHVEFETCSESGIVAGANGKPPRCPYCKTRIDAWRPGQGLDWPATEERPCPNCGTGVTLHALDWRHSAGVGRFFIKVWGVFEGEAVPTSRLMEHLETVTGMAWDYFYRRG